MASWLKFLLLTMLLSGCSAGYHLQRAQHHLEVAQKKDPGITHIKKDSIKEDIVIPGKETEFVFVEVPGETITLTKDSIQIKYRPGKTVHDTTYLEVKCPPDTVQVWHTNTAEVNEVRCTPKEMVKTMLGIGNFGYYLIISLMGAGILLGIYFKLIVPKWPNIFK